MTDYTLFDYSNTSRILGASRSQNLTKDLGDHTHLKIRDPRSPILSQQVASKNPLVKDVPKFVPVPAPRVENTPGQVISLPTMKTPIEESIPSLPTGQTPENIKVFESVLEIDGEINSILDRQMIDLQSKVDSLESQFDICIHFSRQLEEKYREVHQIMRGSALSKFCKKSLRLHPRFFYYCPMLEAITWKNQTKADNVAKKKFMYLREIKAVMAGNMSHFKLRRGAKAQIPDSDCLLTIEGEDGKVIDLMCPSVEVRNKWAKVLNMLICERRSMRNLVNSLHSGQDYDIFELKMMEDISTSKSVNIFGYFCDAFVDD
jgi:hypothetical protein